MKYNDPKCGFGRVYPKDSISLCRVFPKVGPPYPVRWKVVGDTVNCHPEIPYQLCQDHGIACAALEHYVKNRDSCLKDIYAILKPETNDKRGIAKVLFIRVMYGGNFDKWSEDHTGVLIPDHAIPGCVDHLQREVRQISREIRERPYR